MLKRCAEKGVPIAFGTDAGSPFDPYDEASYEMVLMTMAGLTPCQALTAATRGSADFWGFLMNMVHWKKEKEQALYV